MRPRFYAAASLACAFILPSERVNGAGYTFKILYAYNGPSGYTNYAAIQNISSTGAAIGYADNNGNADQVGVYWSPTGTPSNLGPSGYNYTVPYSIVGTQIAGAAYSNSSDNYHAILWSGTSGTYSDLNPATGFISSFITSTDGTTQVGDGYTTGGGGTITHALSWTGSASSVIDLNPSGYSSSVAYGNGSGLIVGEGILTSGVGDESALLWTGDSASDAVNIAPSGYVASGAQSVFGSQIVGEGTPTASDSPHAILWTGGASASASTAIDLNPAGDVESGLIATNGIQQLGTTNATPESGADPTVWTDTASSAVDLTQYVPSGIYDSAAYSIDSSGDVFGTVIDLNDNADEVVEWVYQGTYGGGGTLSWNSTGGTGNGQTWDTTTPNWNNGSTDIPYANGDTVVFNDANDGHYAITLTSTVSPASVTVNSSGNYSITGGGLIVATGGFTKSGTSTLSLGVGLTASSLAINGGNIILAAGTTAGTGSAGHPASNVNITSLTIASSSLFDITNNHIIIDYGSSDPLSTILGYLKTGYNNGGWNGTTGIISSSAQTLTKGLKYGIGWADGNDKTGNVAGLSSGQIELKYTLLGDANLDGTVNGSDFSILAANFGLGVTNWDQGNFLYGSSVNGSDFSALAANFGQGDSGADVSVSQADINALDSFAVANGLPLPTFANVPEPVSTALFLVAAGGFFTRRRRT
jgi:hypothetical protein